ncbi:GFA family protein [Sulfitobacter sp. S190]|uniref:GFA family protein n=1 Tax=Sulfitobacter sp. S190 TaxID=2867022 RepID=UPI0021A6CC5C|nr:GFA family protein [Sulfitobacter sp. S190]UWR23486.1 GFA family protein [Sulfitobacter sp. S190]
MKISAQCHCGACALTATLPGGLDPARCTCSFCRRRQAAAVTARTDSVIVTKGTDTLTRYSWGTHTAKHYFCKICGIYLYHQRRSDPAECGINLGCIEGVESWTHEPIGWTDGVNHPADQPD